MTSETTFCKKHQEEGDLAPEGKSVLAQEQEITL